MTAAWGLACTLKATVEQTQAFVAYHLGLGATEIWLFFDDPDDPAADRVAGLPAVRAIRCDTAHWTRVGERPDRHQGRQSRNMKYAYRRTKLPWLGHIDVDEYLLPRKPVAEVLAAQHPDWIEMRMAPWEALHDPNLPDDIFTARHFRAGLRGDDKAALRDLAFGQYAPALSAGVLSHAVGKCFLRTGIAGLQPRLHGAFLNGERLRGRPHHPDVALLHFHAEDPARWFDRLDFRLSRGAYQYNEPMAVWLKQATEVERHAFYDRVQAPGPELRDRLQAAGALIEADLGLRARVEEMFGA
jgi:hypothetical protein